MPASGGINRHHNQRFQKDVAVLHPGEYFSTDEDIIISTVLGSCIAVALYDPVVNLGGLNHFMLPGELHSRRFFAEESGRYGMFAMELLINDMLKAGARKNRLVAKVFGGGHVLDNTSGRIPESNILFARDFLETEAIPILSHDVGGTSARKILFFAATARVLVKRFAGRSAVSVEREEQKYFSKIKKRKTNDPNEPLFF